MWYNIITAKEYQKEKERNEMTKRGTVFVDIIKSVCWTNGWGTNGSTRCFPEYENGEELSWLVDNGYLFHYQKRETHTRYGKRIANRSISDRYGITRKGWDVAGKFVDAAEIELAYQQPYYPTRP